MPWSTSGERGVPVTETPPPGPWGRVVNALPALAFLATFGWFFVDKNRSARTVFGSGRGLLTVAVIVAGYVGIAFFLRRVVRWNWLAPVALSVLVLGLAAWIVRPYYVDETANRSLVAARILDASDVTPTTVPSTPPSIASPSTDAETPVDPVPATAGPTTEAPTTVAPTTAAAGPVRLSTGALRGIDHDATGRASLIRTADGALVVRFEQFDIEGTPDPFVYLVDRGDARDLGGVALGRLEGNQGDVLDYAVPDGVPAGPGWTILVWCRSFAVPIANATQAAA